MRNIDVSQLRTKPNGHNLMSAKLRAFLCCMQQPALPALPAVATATTNQWQLPTLTITSAHEGSRTAEQAAAVGIVNGLRTIPTHLGNTRC